MRFLKLASANNPATDFILLNGGYFDKDGEKIENFNEFNGFLCTSFQSLGISRKLEFLAINNRQFVVENNPEFKKYGLTIEILTKYSEYEAKHRELITFLDRNKKDGFRLYYRPYNDMDLRYCLCDIETSSKTDKFQPISLTLIQESLWLGDVKRVTSVKVVNEKENLFAFDEDETIEGYYSAGFEYDEDLQEYCMEFFFDAFTEAEIANASYNEIPLNIKIYGPCVTPAIFLYRKGENTPIRKIQLEVTIADGDYVEINANIKNNGVWLVKNGEKEKRNYSGYIANENGSPYIYIGNGEYVLTVIDNSMSICEVEFSYQEEYSE